MLLGTFSEYCGYQCTSLTVLESSINITRTKSTFGEIRALGIIEKPGWAAEEEEAGPGSSPHSSNNVPTYIHCTPG